MDFQLASIKDLNELRESIISDVRKSKSFYYMSESANALVHEGRIKVGIANFEEEKDSGS